MKAYYKNELTTIYNGDCLEVMDYLIEQGVKVDAIITDPPYGTTACSWDNVIPFDKMWERLKLLRKDTTAIVLFGSEPFSSKLRVSNIKEYKYDWTWIKNVATGFLNAKTMPLKNIEDISIFYNKQCIYNPQKTTGHIPTNACKGSSNGTVYSGTNLRNYEGGVTDRFPLKTQYFNSVSNIDREHPTQKPLELLKYLIETYTNKGDLILDFTAGSFTTCVAAEQLNRRSIGIELEQKYCDVGVKRLSQLQLRLDI
jgi:site-specific DNA-methyltransferase (adenine-specific)